MKWPKRFRNDPAKAGEIATGVCELTPTVFFYGEHGPRSCQWVIEHRDDLIGRQTYHRGECWYEAIRVARELAIGNEEEQAATILDQIRRRFVQIREACELTQSDLSRISGVSKYAILTFERGSKEPKLSTVILLTEALGITLGDLAEPAMRPGEIDICYNVPQVALRLNVSESTIRDVIARGHLKAKRIGRRSIIVQESEINRYLAECENSATYGGGTGRRRRERRQAFRPSGVRGRTDDA